RSLRLVWPGLSDLGMHLPDVPPGERLQPGIPDVRPDVPIEPSRRPLRLPFGPIRLPSRDLLLDDGSNSALVGLPLLRERISALGPVLPAEAVRVLPPVVHVVASRRRPEHHQPLRRAVPQHVAFSAGRVNADPEAG